MQIYRVVKLQTYKKCVFLFAPRQVGRFYRQLFRINFSLTVEYPKVDEMAHSNGVHLIAKGPSANNTTISKKRLQVGTQSLRPKTAWGKGIND